MTREFYEQKIVHLKAGIDDVKKAIVEVGKLSNNICSEDLQLSLGHLYAVEEDLLAQISDCERRLSELQTA
jgi:hypothetical protein